MTDERTVELRVEIPGPPVSAERVRVVRGGSYLPAKSRAYQKHVAWCVLAELNRSWTSARIQAARLPSARWGVALTFCCEDARRRDLDNLAKNMLDACNGILWADDALIDELYIRRGPPDRERAGAILRAWVL